MKFFTSRYVLFCRARYPSQWACWRTCSICMIIPVILCWGRWDSAQLSASSGPCRRQKASLGFCMRKGSGAADGNLTFARKDICHKLEGSFMPLVPSEPLMQLERSSSKCPPRHRFELLPLCHTLPRCPLPRARFPKASLSLATGKSWVWRPNSTGSHSDLQPALELEIHFQYP